MKEKVVKGEEVDDENIRKKEKRIGYRNRQDKEAVEEAKEGIEEKNKRQ